MFLMFFKTLISLISRWIYFLLSQILDNHLKFNIVPSPTLGGLKVRVMD